MDEKELSLTPSQVSALQEIRQRLRAKFNIAALTLYGSAARGETDDESDIDLLVLTVEPLSRLERHRITDIVFHVNLEHGTNFSTLVVDARSWQVGPLSVLPIRGFVDSEGIPV